MNVNDQACLGRMLHVDIPGRNGIDRVARYSGLAEVLYWLPGISVLKPGTKQSCGKPFPAY